MAAGMVLWCRRIRARSEEYVAGGVHRRQSGGIIMFRILVALAFAFVLALPSASSSAAPAPAAGAVYAVGYIEIVTTSVPDALPVLRAYRDAAMREMGATSVQLLREAVAPNRFLLLETWGNQAAYDAHLKAMSTTDLVQKLRPYQAAPPYLKAHRALLVAAPPANPPAGNPVFAITHVTLAAAQANAAQAHLRTIAEGSRRERGAIRFDVLQEPGNRGNHLTIVEAWAGTTASEQHRGALPTRTFRDRIHPMLDAPVDERIYSAVN
jgi:quinol monooxygenase YgiN